MPTTVPYGLVFSDNAADTSTSPNTYRECFTDIRVAVVRIVDESVRGDHVGDRLVLV
jgi:hypothetical protein